MLSSQTSEVCHHCGVSLSTVKTPLFTHNRSWYFCSKACNDAMADMIDAEGTVCSHLQTISEQTGMDDDLLKIAVRFVVGKAIQVRKQREDSRNNRIIVISDDNDAPVEITSATADSTVSGSACAVVNGLVFNSSVTSIEQMVGHGNINDPGIKQTILNVAKMLWTVLPKAVKDTLYGIKDSTVHDFEAFVSDVTNITSRVNANVHGLHFNDVHNTQYGIGLYPLCAMFNHSCYPNCVFVNQGAKLTIRSIKDIAAGEELCINYICLGQKTLSRQYELLTEKSFVCACRRCTLTPYSVDEYNHFKAEILLQGVRVEANTAVKEINFAQTMTDILKYCVYNAHPPSSEPTTAPVSVEEGKKKKDKKDLLPTFSVVMNINDVIPSGVYIEAKSCPVPIDTHQHTDTDLPATFSSALVLSETVVKTYTDSDDWLNQHLTVPYVSSADATNTTTFTTVSAIEQQVKLRLDNAIQLYSSDGVTMEQRKTALEACFLECVKYLAPGHEHFFTLLPLLVNVYSRLNDFKSKMECNQLLAVLSEQFMPAAFLPLANTYESLYMSAHRLEQDIGKLSGSKGMLLKKMYGAKVKQVKKEYTEKHLRVLEVCLGKDHPRYVTVAANVALL